MRAPVIALLTDFGARDWYAGALKGVLASRAPRVAVADITHEIPPQDVAAGAFTLAAAAPWFPRGTVFLAVVDPGVGSRRALLAAWADGRQFVGPDNGLLALCLQQATRLRVVRLNRPRHWLPDVSRTFQGRDIMAPVAAYLARGGRLSALGSPVRRFHPLALPVPQRRGRRMTGRVVHVDTYGNLITNLPAALLPPNGPVAAIRCQGCRARVVSSYADGRARELLAMAGSLGFVELAVRDGSAASACGSARGDAVECTLTGSG